MFAIASFLFGLSVGLSFNTTEIIHHRRHYHQHCRVTLRLFSLEATDCFSFLFLFSQLNQSHRLSVPLEPRGSLTIFVSFQGKKNMLTAQLQLTRLRSVAPHTLPYNGRLHCPHGRPQQILPTPAPHVHLTPHGTLSSSAFETRDSQETELQSLTGVSSTLPRVRTFRLLETSGVECECECELSRMRARALSAGIGVRKLTFLADRHRGRNMHIPYILIPG